MEQAPSSSRTTAAPSSTAIETLYSLPSNSRRFVTNYNEAYPHAQLNNEGKFLALAFINLGGKRKSVEKNQALREGLAKINVAIISITEYDPSRTSMRLTR